MMGTAEFVGPDVVDFDRLSEYHRKVATTEFCSRRGGRPTKCQPSIPPSQLLIEAAESGDAVSQFVCGNRFKKEDGVPRDVVKAARYFKKAADQEHAGGQCNYGFCLRNGIGVTRELVKGTEYYRMAANQGNAQGQYNHDSLLENGIGIRVYFDKAAAC
jgi:TPR repeat protein